MSFGHSPYGYESGVYIRKHVNDDTRGRIILDRDVSRLRERRERRVRLRHRHRQRARYRRNRYPTAARNGHVENPLFDVGRDPARRELSSSPQNDRESSDHRRTQSHRTGQQQPRKVKGADHDGGTHELYACADRKNRRQDPFMPNEKGVCLVGRRPLSGDDGSHPVGVTHLHVGTVGYGSRSAHRRRSHPRSVASVADHLGSSALRWLVYAARTQPYDLRHTLVRVNGPLPHGRFSLTTPLMLNRILDALYRAITTPRGDTLAPLRVSKDLARRLNATFGQPLALRDELAKREAARGRLDQLRAGSPRSPSPAVRARATEAEVPPVLVYFEKNRNQRELERIEELLRAKNIAWKGLDVTGDEATIEFVTRRAGCDKDDLPVVFVADRAIGTYDALVRADVGGELAPLVRPAPAN